jgi:hypothetical protein
VGKAKIRISLFKQMLTVQCEIDVPMKPREALAEPCRLICDSAKFGTIIFEIGEAANELGENCDARVSQKSSKNNIYDSSDGLVSSHLPIGTKTKWV